MKKLLMRVFGVGKPDPAARRDAATWDLAQKKQAAEKLLREGGHSRKDATRLVSEMFRGLRT